MNPYRAMAIANRRAAAYKIRTDLAAKAAADKKAAQDAKNEALYQQNNAIVATGPSKYEERAGVGPINYEGTRDAKTGALLDKYKVDAYAGEANQALKQQAFAAGESPWAQMQLQKQQMEQAGSRDQVAKTQAQSLAQAQAGLMRQGGLSSASRARMAQMGAKDMARANQGVESAGAASRLGIQSQDIDRKQGLLSNFANQETQAQGANIDTQKQDLVQKATFDVNKYKEQMAAWGAEKTAKAQAKAGGGGKK